MSSGNAELRRVVKTLRPHQPGTLKLTRRYGSALVCVRYRQDAGGRMRYTTVELIVDEAPVQRRTTSLPPIVAVRIVWDEETLRHRAKAMGAKWDPATRLWRMSLRSARALDLTDRIQPPLVKDGQRR